MASSEDTANGPATPDDPGRELPYLDLDALEQRARALLPADVYDYYAGGSGRETTIAAGRQADPSIASAEALPEVVEAVGGDAEVYADGGMRSGSDVLAALALGARAVFLGRPVAWGLTAGGADGVARVIGGLTDELAHTMAVCGLDDVEAVPRDAVVRAPWASR